MREWWNGLVVRQRAGFGLYAGALILLMLSLPTAFYDDGAGYSESGWALVLEIVEIAWSAPEFFVADTIDEFIEGSLPAFCFLMSYAAALPAGFLLFLAARNVWCCGAGRLFWSLMWLGGPLVFIIVVSNNLPSIQEGYAAWILGVSSAALAQWVMVPRVGGAR